MFKKPYNQIVMQLKQQIVNCEITFPLYSTISSTDTSRCKTAFSIVCCTALCCVLPPGTKRINTSYFAVLSHNPTWQPYNTSDGGNAAHNQIGCHRNGICSTLIRSNSPQTQIQKKCTCMVIISACTFTHVRKCSNGVSLLA